jgi:hypothetical protein
MRSTARASVTSVIPQVSGVDVRGMRETRLAVQALCGLGLMGRGPLQGELGWGELIDPRETRDALLATLRRGLSSRQAAAEPVCRTVIMP